LVEETNWTQFFESFTAEISQFLKKSLSSGTAKGRVGRDGSLQRWSNRSLRATGIHGKTRAKNRGGPWISPMGE
jgi:hypothetical protein